MKRGISVRQIPPRIGEGIAFVENLSSDTAQIPSGGHGVNILSVSVLLRSIATVMVQWQAWGGAFPSLRRDCGAARADRLRFHYGIDSRGG